MKFKKLRLKIKTKNNHSENRKKVGLLLFFTSIGIFFLFVARISYIVIVGKVADVPLDERLESLYRGTEIIQPKRGTIYDRNQRTIAETDLTFSVRVVLSNTYKSGEEDLYLKEENFEKVSTILSKLTSLTYENVYQSLIFGLNDDGTTRFQVEFGNEGRNLSIQERNNIEKALAEENIVGVYFDQSIGRSYPNGIFASHLIGFVSENQDNTLEGNLGIESIYNEFLSGENGLIEYQRNNNGNPIPGTIENIEEGNDGVDIYTTLDSRIQMLMERLLNEVHNESQPESLSAILMKANTGEIVAMSQRPSFHPETLEGMNSENFIWRNLFAEENYEPGSTLKLATIAAAMESGNFNPDEQFESTNIRVEDVEIADHDFGSKGTLTMRQALSWSSNVGMVKLHDKMGNQQWESYLEDFGFGESTFSGVEGEIDGTLPKNNQVDQVMSTFGQGIGVSQFQMLRMFSAFANNGNMLQPHFIKQIVDSKSGEETLFSPEIVGQPISETTAETILEYMRDVVESEDYGTAYGVYNLEGYNVSAKTGTAQIANPIQEGYLRGQHEYLYSSVLLYPSEQPEYIFYLTMKRPERYDRTTLAKIANPLMEYSMKLELDSR